MYSIQTLEKTIEKLGLSYGSDFIHNMTEALAQAVDADLCLIAKINETLTIANTISFYMHGQHVENCQYKLKGTPCQDVACGKVSMYPENVVYLFPEDLMLAEMEIEAYVGASLEDENGKVIGIVVALFHKKLDEPEAIHKLYTLFSSRIALEIDRMEKTRLLELLNKELEDRVQQRTSELRIINKELQETIDEIDQLRGTIPICSYCHKIRNEEGDWDQMEMYISQHSSAKFSHGICPKCAPKVFAEYGLDKK